METRRTGSVLPLSMAVTGTEGKKKKKKVGGVEGAEGGVLVREEGGRQVKEAVVGEGKLLRQW